MKAAAATARAALHPHRVQHNEQTCQLLQLVGQDDLRPTFMRADVWGVCRAFRGWARAELSLLPRVVAVGGIVMRDDDDDDGIATASVESLDLSTMRWCVAGCMPPLPDPRAAHSVSSCGDGRAVVCGGWNAGGTDRMLHLRGTALQWLPGTSTWSALPDLPVRGGAASVVLPDDGRAMVIGGTNGQVLASVLVLAADGSAWSDLPPLERARSGAAAALLPDGKVSISAVAVAGGMLAVGVSPPELYDEGSGRWLTLPHAMVQPRSNVGLVSASAAALTAA
eukprot:COSAG06_NODE_2542_length_6702_cov_6.759049_1_plen_280_part_10